MRDEPAPWLPLRRPKIMCPFGPGITAATPTRGLDLSVDIEFALQNEMSMELFILSELKCVFFLSQILALRGHIVLLFFFLCRTNKLKSALDLNLALGRRASFLFFPRGSKGLGSL